MSNVTHNKDTSHTKKIKTLAMDLGLYLPLRMKCRRDRIFGIIYRPQKFKMMLRIQVFKAMYHPK